jgi:pyrroline-5-carboxylate reductase
MKTFFTLNIGLFGAGRLSRAIAQGLLDAGLPRDNLVLCHQGSSETRKKLEDLGLLGFVVDRHDLIRRSQVILYLVRPQNRQAIEDCTLRDDSVFVSFLAGVPLNRLPVALHDAQRVRVMTSAPDTLRARNGIAARYPVGVLVVDEMLSALQLQLIPLNRESDFHAFTVFGPCLPIAMTNWEGLGHDINESDLLIAVSKFGLGDWEKVVAWAKSVRPRGLSASNRSRYIHEAATPGGVTEAILKAMDLGWSFTASLECGIQRSRELAAASGNPDKAG